MIEISIMLQIKASCAKVWKIISNVDNDTNYWKEITFIRNISHDKNTITREVHLSDGSKCLQLITFYPKEGLNIRWIKGPIMGVKDIMLIYNGNTTIVRVQINYQCRRFWLTGSENILETIQTEAESALQLIKKQAE